MMEAVETFIQQCLTLCRLHDNRDVDYQAVGQKILTAGNVLPYHIHPMVKEICRIAEHLAESDADWIADDTKRTAWDALCSLVIDYADNRWEPTVWVLIAIYAIAQKDRTVHASHSVRVTHAFGKVEIETASDILRSIVIKLTEHIHPDQTDEWHLHNLARMLPQTVENLSCMDITLTEQLSRPRW